MVGVLLALLANWGLQHVPPMRRAFARARPERALATYFGSIVNDDLNIAVLTGSNPNVFYELAVAQCAGRPVILLAEKGQQLPFDVKDQRCVYYDLKPRALFEQVYLKELVGHIRALEAAGFRVPSLLDHYQREAKRGEGARFLGRSVEFGSLDDWLALLESTNDVLSIMGISLDFWRGCKGFAPLVQAKAHAGCKVRMMMMHPENPCLPGLINESLPEQRLIRAQRKIEEMWDYLGKITRGLAGIEVRQARRGTLHGQLTITDSAAVFVQYLHSESSRYSPLWYFPSTMPIWKTFEQEFASFWDLNADTAAG